jgi:hypothetical protein
VGLVKGCVGDGLELVGSDSLGEGIAAAAGYEEEARGEMFSHRSPTPHSHVILEP